MSIPRVSCDQCGRHFPMNKAHTINGVRTICDLCYTKNMQALYKKPFAFRPDAQPGIKKINYGRCVHG